MGIFLAFIGFLGVITFLIIAIFSLLKKNVKAKKSFMLAGASFIVFILGVSIDDDASRVVKDDSKIENEEKQEEGKEEEKEKEPEEKIDQGVYKVDYNENINGLEIEIPEIEVTKRKILVTILTKNTTEETISFYPDQGDIIIDDTQIGANMFSSKGDVSGDIHSGIKKEGILVFLAGDKEFSVENINKVRLNLGRIYSDNYDIETVDFDEIIELKNN